MRTIAVLLLAGLACCSTSSAQAQTAPLRKTAVAAPLTTLASLQAKQVNVDLAFNLDGELSTMPACPTESNTDSCKKPRVQAHSDMVDITYTTLSSFATAPGDTITLKACWAPDSQKTRPWRASNPVIAMSKQCKNIIAKGLSPTKSPAGGYKWMPNEGVPKATYFVRALVVRQATNPNGTLSAVTYPVAFGNSDFFYIKGINSIPTSMKIASALCTCVGPLMFGTYFALTYLRKPKA